MKVSVKSIEFQYTNSWYVLYYDHEPETGETWLVFDKDGNGIHVATHTIVCIVRNPAELGYKAGYQVYVKD